MSKKKPTLLDMARSSVKVCESESTTSQEFATAAGVTKWTANERLRQLAATGKIRKTYKLVNGRAVPAYIEV
jgi:DNA-binding Lrp family transcriptional regulator